MFVVSVEEHGVPKTGVPLLGDHHVVDPIGKPHRTKTSINPGTFQKDQGQFLQAEEFTRVIVFRVTGALYIAIVVGTTHPEAGFNTYPQDAG